MDTNFWWFFDVAVAAAVMAGVYVFARKKLLRSVAVLACCFVSFLASLYISSLAEEYIYDSKVRDYNIQQIENLIDENVLSRKAENILDNRGYKGIEKGEGIAVKYVWDAMAEMDAMEMVDNLLAENLRFYIPDKSAKLFDIIGYEGYEKISMLFVSEDSKQAAAYIEENYTADVSRNIIRLLCFIIILFVLTAVTGTAAWFILKKKSFTAPEGYIINHAVGSAVGVIMGVLAVFIIAAGIRLLISLSNDSMMFFNSGVISKTRLFRHIYGLTMKF